MPFERALEQERLNRSHGIGLWFNKCLLTKEIGPSTFLNDQQWKVELVLSTSTRINLF